MLTDVCIQVGQRIRELRKAKGWRQLDLAEHANVHSVHISDLEQGKREAGLRNLGALSRALGVTLSQMLEGIDVSDPATTAGPPEGDK